MRMPSRREFLSRSALGLGCTALPTPLRWASPPRRLPARADAVIQIHLDGGMSHVDTWDPKPDAPVEVRGPLGTVKSRLAGEPLGEVFAKTAAVADRLVLLRAMHHTEADHDRAHHSVLTGYQPSPALTYPSLGSIAAHELGVRNDLPPYVCIPTAQRFLGNGYLSAAFAPFAVGGNPAADGYKVRDLDAQKGVDAARRQRRGELLHELDAGFQRLGDADGVHALAEYYRLAGALIESPKARAAFDVGAEPEAMKDRYGKRPFGMGLLLARRLVAGGARYVVVPRGGFDHHQQIATGLPGALAEVDQALAALLQDLDAAGLLARTLVLVTTEFGRTPRLNGDAGRDHWPRVFSVALAGGGCKRGLVFGSSDGNGVDPAEGGTTPADLAATALTLLGIDPEARLLAAGNRPVALVRDGRVLTEILA